MSLTGNQNAFKVLGTRSKAKYGCCGDYEYMSTPSTTTQTFEQATQCSSCPPGFGFIGQNDDIVCSSSFACSCPNGVAATGLACIANDANICSSCSAGYYNTGACTECTSSCAVGQYKSGIPCNGSTTTDTQSCAACSNGGSSYSCSFGKYLNGKACLGHGDADTQTCNNCAIGKYQNQERSTAASCKTCDIGQSSATASVACSNCASGQSQEKGKQLLLWSI